MLIKTSKKDPSFYSIASHKKPHSFYELQVTQHVKNILSQHSQNLTHFAIFPGKMFLVGVRKKNGTASFLDTQELHSQSTWRTSVCIFLYILVRKFCFTTFDKGLWTN